MIEIITIGDELTSGSTVDENARFIAETIHSIGQSVSRITTIGDAVEDIKYTLQNMLKETRFVIITGGLGPTEDDRTSQAAAAAFDRKLVLNREALYSMEEKLRKFKRAVSVAGKKQAMLPEGCRVVPNPVGTACGFLIEDGKRHFIFLPGVPEEASVICESFLVEHLKKSLNSKQVILSKTLKVFGLWESAIQERLHGVLPEGSTVSLAYYPRYPDVRLKTTGKGVDPDEVQKDLDRFCEIIYEKIGEYIYSDRDELIEEVVGELLRKERATLAVAESCTGGLITNRLTNIQGSSQYLEQSFIVYSNRSKEELLKVPPNVINEFGAVSEPVARLMAQGARKLSGTTYGLAVTGIAGPSGGSTEKPIGTVFIGISTSYNTEVKKHHFRGDRCRIKTMSSQVALDLLRRTILGED